MDATQLLTSILLQSCSNLPVIFVNVDVNFMTLCVLLTMLFSVLPL